jgi:hypothetical protein
MHLPLEDDEAVDAERVVGVTATFTKRAETYVLTQDGEAMGVFHSAEAAMQFVANRDGDSGEWAYSNSHGQMWKRHAARFNSYWVIQETPEFLMNGGWVK